MHAEGNQLVARPTDVADIELRCRTDFLHEAELISQPVEAIPRPRQRREARQFRDIAHVEPHVDETPAMPAKGAHFPDGDAGTFVQAPERLTIEARLGIDTQRRAAERDQAQESRR